jgi:hypothetical protein
MYRRWLECLDVAAKLIVCQLMMPLTLLFDQTTCCDDTRLVVMIPICVSEISAIASIRAVC